MHACRWSTTVFTVVLITSLLSGCRGVGPQGQQIQLNEDATVRLSDVSAPPQRLALTDGATNGAHQMKRPSTGDEMPAVRLSDQSGNDGEIKTRLARTQPSAQTAVVPPSPPTRQASVTSSVAETKAKQGSRPQRSGAVETLLATNRETARSKRQSQPASGTAKTQASPTANRSSSPTVAESSVGDRREPLVRTGKSVKFSDLPEDVRKKAMKRLMANLAKQAVPTSQPSAMDQALSGALNALPTLPPLRKTKPDVPPLRIAASKPKPVRREPNRDPTPANDRSFLRDVQVSDLVAPKRKTRADGVTSKVAVMGDASAKRSVAIATQAPAEPAVASAPPVSIDLPSPKSKTPPKTKSKLASTKLPSPKSVLVGGLSDESPPSANETNKHENHVAANSSRFVMPPMPKSEGELAVTKDASPSSTEVSAAAPHSPVAKLTAAELALLEDLHDEDFELSSLARELHPLPHELHRDSFRFSRVGLPNPNGYFADIPLRDPIVTQAASSESQDARSADGSATRMASAHVPIQSPGPKFSADEPKVAQIASVNAGDVSPRGTSRPVAPTPSYDLSAGDNSTSGPSSSSESSAPIALEFPENAMAESKVLPAKLDLPSQSSKRTDRSEKNSDTASISVATPVDPGSMSDKQLYDALLARLTDPSQSETPAERHRRQIMARHLMVLAGNREAAIKDMKGLSEQEQQFLRNQLEGLYAMVDPNGHPVAGRRFSSALPNFRQATMYLSAAAAALEVRGLEFCTEIEAYGQIKPFPSRQFAASQPVILYCEVDNFTARQTDAGYETHLKGSYDIYNAAGEKVVSQLLPADKQMSRKLLRDYFVAYQMNLPAKLVPGKYRLQLTMEDVDGQKYGQSEIAFRITQ